MKIFLLFAVLLISLLSKAQMANPASLYACEHIADDFAVFDLAMAIPQVLGSQNQAGYNVTFHLTNMDAQTNTNPVTNLYTGMDGESLYSRVEDIYTGSHAVGTLDLHVSDTPDLNPYIGIVSCDGSPQDGQAVFDLTQSEATIHSNNPNFVTVYFLNPANDFPIANPTQYFNTSNPQTIYVRVENPNCYTMTSFPISVVDCSADSDSDLVPTGDEDVNLDGNLANDDTDNDGIPNYLDDDDDGDGILTANEDYNGNGDPTDDDTDSSGTPDYLEKGVALSISKASKFDFSVYPNPASEKTSIQLENNLFVKSVSLYGLKGGQIQKTEVYGTMYRMDVDVSQLPAGVYFLVIESEKGKSVEKLLVR